MNVPSVGALRPSTVTLKDLNLDLDKLANLLGSCAPIHNQAFVTAKRGLLSLESVEDQKMVIRKSYERGMPSNYFLLESFQELGLEKAKTILDLFMSGDEMDKWIGNKFIEYLKQVKELPELWDIK